MENPPEQEPAPGYWQPPTYPAYPPQTGYPGQYPPTGQPYPPTGQPPYGPPSQAYPGQPYPTGQPYPPTGQPYPPTGQPPYGYPNTGYPGTSPYGMPPGAPGTQPRRSFTGLIIAGIVIVALIVGTLIHVNGATGAVKSYMDDISAFDFDAAYNLICPSEQPALQASFAQTKASFAQLQSQGTYSIDTSKLGYVLKSGGFTSAVVTVVGSLTVTSTVSGTTQSQTVPVTNGDVQLGLNGLGWCLYALPTSTSS